MDATSIDDVALRAGVAKGTFYHHFESKTALLLALREDVIKRFSEEVVEAFDACPADRPWQKLDAWVHAAVQGYVTMGSLPDIVFMGPHESARWTGSGTPFMEKLTALLEDGQTRGIWHVEETSIAATMIFRGILGVVDDLILSGGDLQRAGPATATLAAAMVRRVQPTSESTSPQPSAPPLSAAVRRLSRRLGPEDTPGAI